MPKRYHEGHKSIHPHLAGKPETKYYDDGVFTVHGDDSAVAMMPQSVVYKSVSSPYKSLPDAYEDTPVGVDRQIGNDISQMHKGFKPSKV